tara:strand:- start:346 stop:531 length:186 start_codon:yes stop_codon:yes gene_type:complete
MQSSWINKYILWAWEKIFELFLKKNKKKRAPIYFIIVYYYSELMIRNMTYDLNNNLKKGIL